jgi:DNA-directed RNA polymerase specialized sigma subunit
MTAATQGPETTKVDALWERFKASGDADARERLILHYSPLVKYVAGRVGAGLPRSVDQNDLASYGLFGLMRSTSSIWNVASSSRPTPSTGSKARSSTS